jgi:ABC-type branched-subunit amino acid transport system permease subunit
MDEKNGNHNLHLCVVTLIVCTLVSAASIIWIVDLVQESFQSTNAMALIITDAGIKSDDPNLERNLSVATDALSMCKDFAWALVVGLLVCLTAVIVRIKRSPFGGVGVKGRGRESKRP